MKKKQRTLIGDIKLSLALSPILVVCFILVASLGEDLSNLIHGESHASNEIVIDTPSEPNKRVLEESNINTLEVENNALKSEIDRLRTALEIRETKNKSSQERKQIIIDVLNGNLKNNLAMKGEVFYNASVENNVNPMLMVAIANHETGFGTSKILRTHNNVGGHYINGSFKYYNNIDESIYAQARILKRYYIDEGLNSIDLIGNKYCPIGASNDPNNVNQYWVPKVTEYYLHIIKQIKEKGVNV